MDLFICCEVQGQIIDDFASCHFKTFLFLSKEVGSSHVNNGGKMICRLLP